MVESLMARPRETAQTEDEVPHQHGPRRSVGFVARRIVRRFLQDRGFAAASALTLQTVLSAVATTVTLLGALAAAGSGGRASDKVADVLAPVLSAGLLDRVRGALEDASRADGGWVVLGVGALAALLAAVGYVASVRAATNRAWQALEGRSGWRLAGAQLLVGLAAFVLAVVIATLLVTAGPMVAPLLAAFGLYPSNDELTVWSYAVWPVLAGALVVLVALLHRALPNVRFGRTRLITWGSLVTIVGWVAVGAGMAFYLAWYPTWNHTLGTTIGLALVLLGLWVGHAALVLGAEVDAELERGRELQGGRAAEERLQVPLRHDQALPRTELRERRAVERMREIRVAAGAHGNPDDRPFARR